MTGRAVGILMLVAALVAGAGLYYTQVYAYYDRVGTPADGVMLTTVGGGELQALPAEGYEAIDAASSPLRYRACFTTSASLATLTETFRIEDRPTPLVTPGWFDCFDAGEIARALETGDAVAFTARENVVYGVDRVTAVFRDGRGRSWHQINRCGREVFEGNPPPTGCPPAPES